MERWRDRGREETRSDDGEIVEIRLLSEDLPCLVANWEGADERSSSAVDWTGDDRGLLPICNLMGSGFVNSRV